MAKSLWKTKKFVKLDPVGMCNINICAYVLLTYILETTINESWHKFINSKALPRSGKDTLEGRQRMLDLLKLHPQLCPGVRCYLKVAAALLV